MDTLHVDGPVLRHVMLNDATADSIRVRYAQGCGGYKTVAKEFGIRADQVRAIILGRAWNDDGRVPRKPYTPEKEALYQADRALRQAT